MQKNIILFNRTHGNNKTKKKKYYLFHKKTAKYLSGVIELPRIKLMSIQRIIITFRSEDFLFFLSNIIILSIRLDFSNAHYSPIYLIIYY